MTAKNRAMRCKALIVNHLKTRHMCWAHLWQAVGPRLGVAAMRQVVCLTLMTRINADNVAQISENQRNQRFF